MPREDDENENRRDDVLERDFMRGSDRNDVLFSEYLKDRQVGRERETVLFNEELKQGRRTDVQHDDRDSLRFRDAAIHSTAVGSLEGETATVGDEEQENVPDEEHAPGTNK